jgi:hypothetical protein
MPEAGGRTTVLIDDVPYRLDGDELRRVDLLDDSQHWTLLPCRVRRAPGAGDCRVSYITAEPAPTPPSARSTRKRLRAVVWRADFGARRPAPAEGTFLAVDARLYQIIDNRPRCSPATCIAWASIRAGWCQDSRFKPRCSFAKVFMPG